MKIRFKFHEPKKHSNVYHEIDENGKDISGFGEPHIIGMIYVKKRGPFTSAHRFVEMDLKVVEE